MSENLEFKDVDVTIQKSRWDITIIIKHKDGKVEKFIASADEGVTFGDEIFFGTEEEYNKFVCW